MKRLILTLFFCLPLFANNSFNTMKKCEQIKLSKFTSLLSCHNFDYLIEYKLEDDEEKDNIKRITVITKKDEKILIKNMDK